MTMTRRDWLTATAAMPLSTAIAAPSASGAGAAALPAVAAFAPTDIAYLDNGSQHPVPLASLEAVNAYYAKRTLDPAAQAYSLDEDGPRAMFAALVGADADEIAWVQSTTAGEQMVLRALGLPASGGHIVTDTLHFFGSLPLYEEMAKRGCTVTWLRPVDGRIRLADMKAAVRKDTRLIALSLVSTINGFEHDLKAVCDIAHAAGALVYADIIHAAGCVPVDLHASGVDFAACASYKWLMGDFGLGFLYARRDVQPRLQRVNVGYYGMETFQPHVYPLDPPGAAVADYSFQRNATGAFAIGTHSHAVIAQLGASLAYIAALGVPAIQAHAQELCDRLKRELPRRGYPLMTPADARTPIVTCLLADARRKLAEPMAAAKVRLTISANRFRLTPSIQTTHADIDRFLAALPRA